MATSHSYNFEGGVILGRIGSAWFISYLYYKYVDNTHRNWEKGITEKSLNSRRSKTNNSTNYHQLWLREILNMEQLDKNKNSVNLNSTQIKGMAKQILEKLL